MSAEMILAVAAVVGVMTTGGGLVHTIRKNGSAQVKRDAAQADHLAARDAVLANNQEAIIARLDDKEVGLQAVNAKISTMQTHCASISSTFAEQIKGHTRDIKDLKGK